MNSERNEAFIGLLKEYEGGDASKLNELSELVYNDLRRIAASVYSLASGRIGPRLRAFGVDLHTLALGCTRPTRAAI